MATPESILKSCQESMTKAKDYLLKEFKGVRTGRASPSLIEFVKVEIYGSQQDLKNIASISVPEATQLLVRPFDKSNLTEIRKAIESSGLGLNPQTDGNQMRINLPPLSGDRRKQLVVHCKKLAEDAKVTIRNARRDANKAADGLKGTGVPEDRLEKLKHDIQELLKKAETEVDEATAKKSKEIETV
jgi:ribosome recycling factor